MTIDRRVYAKIQLYSIGFLTNLSQLLIQIGRIHNALLIRFGIVQVLIPFHKKCTNKFMQLNRHVQRDRNQVIE